MKILYVTTVSSTLNGFLIPHIKMLVEDGHQVDIACNIDHPLKTELIGMTTNTFNIKFSRSPFAISNIYAYREMRELVLLNKYDIVHTHTPIASAITRLACKNLVDTRVFYTAHGFHFHKGSPVINWLIYYPVELYLSKFTDTIITINSEDFKRSKAKFHSKRIVYVPGVGIDINKFKNIEQNKEQKRRELNLSDDAIILLSVGELNNNKNHKVVIKALSRLKNPNIHYLICGEGPLENNLNSLAKELNMKNNVHLLGYRNDVIEIYSAVDIFIFPSLREGLPVSVMEAMASSLPLIVSSIRGNNDLVEEKVNGLKFVPNNTKMLSEIIKYCIENKELLNKMAMENEKIVKNYSNTQIKSDLKKIYNMELSN